MGDDIICNADHFGMLILSCDSSHRTKAWCHKRQPVLDDQDVRTLLFEFSSQFPPADRINAGNFPLNRNIGGRRLAELAGSGKENAGILGGKSADGSFVALPDEFQYQPFIEGSQASAKRMRCSQQDHLHGRSNI